MKNKHLTSTQRYSIQVLLQENTPIKRVAELLETDKSSIYREIRRNKNTHGVYNASRAQMLSDERKERFGRVRKFTPLIAKHIREKLETDQWSPAQIVGKCKLLHVSMV